MRSPGNVITLISIGAVLAAASFAFSGNPKTEPPIVPGQCYSALAKEYLTDPTASTGTVIFRCAYVCMDSQGRTSFVRATGSADAAQAKRDETATVCDGVILKSIGPGLFDIDRVLPFWAVESSRPEFWDWARLSAPELPAAEFAARKAAFQGMMSSLSAIYGSTTVPMFGAAAKQLAEIGKDSAEGRRLLDRHLGELVKLQLAGQMPARTADGLVQGAILAHGRFLIGLAAVDSPQLGRRKIR